jgi:HK97 family phage prohead protease
VSAPANFFIKAVEGDEDLFAFRYDFIPEGKALEEGEADVVSVQDNGDLIIEGYAAVWDGEDREGENFAEGAFTRGIKSFLANQAALCYYHKGDKLLGRVLDLKQDGKGLRLKARVDGAIKNHPELGVYYEQIKNGSMRGMSVGGFFKRALVGGKPKIVDVDMTEISCTGVPIHPGTSLSVVAGKALRDMPVLDGAPEGEIRAEDEAQINFMIEELTNVIKRIEDGVARRRQ